MKKKSLLTFAVGCIMSLVSCGEKPHEVNQELPEDDPSSEITIKFWHCLGNTKTSNLEKWVVEPFNAMYKGKYKVEAEAIAGAYDDLHDAIKTKLAADEVPALTMGYPDSFAEYITKDIEDSNILRLNNFIYDKNFGYSEEEIADFVPEYFAEGTHYQFDGIWSMPMYKSTEAMYYNVSYMYGANSQNDKIFHLNDKKHPELEDQTYKTLVGKVRGKKTVPEADLVALKNHVDAHGGYSYVVPEGDITWDAWIALGRQMLKDRKAAGCDDEFYPLGYDSDSNLMITQMAQRDIGYTSSKAEGDDHFLFYNDENRSKTVGLVTEINGYIKEGVLLTKYASGGSYTNTFFNEGKMAMTVGSTGGSSYNVSQNFMVGLHSVPYKGKKLYIQQGPSICFFDRVTTDEELNKYIHKGAWLLYKMLADPEVNCKVALYNSYDPVRISSYNEDDPNSYYSKWIANKGQGLQYDIPCLTKTLKNYYMTSDVFVGSSTARTQIGKTIDYVLNNEQEPDMAVLMAFSECHDSL